MQNRPLGRFFAFRVQMITMRQLFSALAVAGLLSVACTKEASNKTDANVAVSSGDANLKKPAAFSADSLSVADSVVISPTLTLEYNQKLLVFNGVNKKLLDSLYSNVLFNDGKVLSDYSGPAVQKSATARMQKYFEDSKNDYRDFMPERPQKWDQHSAMKIFSNANGYLTVQYTGYGYTGGAHGYAFENYRTVDLMKQENMGLHHIVDVKAVPWNRLLLEAAGTKKGELFDSSTLTFTPNFFVDNRALTFVYGQYEIAPYAAGIIHISIPLTKISAALKPDFKARMGMQ